DSSGSYESYGSNNSDLVELIYWGNNNSSEDSNSSANNETDLNDISINETNLSENFTNLSDEIFSRNGIDYILREGIEYKLASSVKGASEISFNPSLPSSVCVGVSGNEKINITVQGGFYPSANDKTFDYCLSLTEDKRITATLTLTIMEDDWPLSDDVIATKSLTDYIYCSDLYLGEGSVDYSKIFENVDLSPQFSGIGDVNTIEVYGTVKLTSSYLSSVAYSTSTYDITKKTDCQCISGSCCNLVTHRLFSNGNQPAGYTDKYYCSGTISPTTTSYCMKRDYYCNGNDSDFHTDISNLDTCGICEYCADGDPTCNYYPSSAKCSSLQDCDNKNYYHITGTQGATSTSYCKYADYNDNYRYCNGAGSCSSLICPLGSDIITATAGTCKYIDGCSDSTSGTVKNYAVGTPCGTSKKCDGSGNCNEESCTNECSLGQTRCSGNYKQTCGNYDTDSCLEWGGDVNCPYGCLDGNCIGCSCGSWQNGACGGGGCLSTQRQQTRICTPSGCDIQSQCIIDSSCNVQCGGIDTSCGTYPNCANCNSNDGCSLDYYRDYFCSSNLAGCSYSSDNCNDCSCSCGNYGKSNEVGYCSDGKDNDCDSKIDGADSDCQQCLSGAKRCNGNILETCKSDGSGWQTTENCGTAKYCSGISCLACSTGYANCDQNAANGCEISLNNDNTNCGICGKVCASGTICQSDVCVSICTNECTSGQTKCLNINTKQTCGNYDADSCTEWGGNILCQYGCSNGACISCTSHSSSSCSDNDVYWYNSCGAMEEKKTECGTSGYTGSNYCSDNDVYRDFTDKGCSGSGCTSSTSKNKIEECQYGCSNGACISCTSHSSSSCSDNDVYWYNSCGVMEEKKTECGTSGYTGSNYCSDNDVYRDFTDKGCSGSGCTSSTSKNKIEECQYGCSNGACISCTSHSSSSCSDNDVYWYNS
ncbi:MAG: hypothetical protein WC916_07975, partial [Candidatus Woesearchaeota archaeon]